MAVDWTNLACAEGYAFVEFIEKTGALFRCKVKVINSDLYSVNQKVYLANCSNLIGIYEGSDIYLVPATDINGYEE